MAYAGYLIKLHKTDTNSQDTTYEVPLSYIKHSSYSATLNTQDLDSYEDANGVLHRTALSHTVPKVEFETVAMLKQSDVDTLFSNIRGMYTNENEKRVDAEVFIPETGTYVRQDMYLKPSISFPIYSANATEIRYNSIQISLIGY